MGLFNLFKKDANAGELDYLSLAETAEKNGDFLGAINQYQKAIEFVFIKNNRAPKQYRHITKKIINCYIKLQDYDKIFEMWSEQYDPLDYGPREMYELIKILDAGQKNDLISKIYEQAGKKLWINKVDFLIKQKKIPEANALMNEIFAEMPVSGDLLQELWLKKAKLCLSLRKWDEACKYLNKLLEKNMRNAEALRLKDFCMKQVRMG